MRQESASALFERERAHAFCQCRSWIKSVVSTEKGERAEDIQASAHPSYGICFIIRMHACCKSQWLSGANELTMHPRVHSSVVRPAILPSRFSLRPARSRQSFQTRRVDFGSLLFLSLHRSNAFLCHSSLLTPSPLSASDESFPSHILPMRFFLITFAILIRFIHECYREMLARNATFVPSAFLGSGAEC